MHFKSQSDKNKNKNKHYYGANFANTTLSILTQLTSVRLLYLLISTRATFEDGYREHQQKDKYWVCKMVISVYGVS